MFAAQSDWNAAEMERAEGVRRIRKHHGLQLLCVREEDGRQLEAVVRPKICNLILINLLLLKCCCSL